MRNRRSIGLSVLALLVAAPALAQNPSKATEEKGSEPSKGTTSTVSTQPPITIQHLRPQDQRGISIFEPPKTDNVAYDGFKAGLGRCFHAAATVTRSQQQG
jgi:hypothetical protein